MSGKNVNFGDKKIKKSDFYKYKKLIKIDGIDVKEEPHSSKNSFNSFIYWIQ